MRPITSPLGRFAIATTENAAKPYCIIDLSSGKYVKNEKGFVCSYKGIGDAKRALSVMDDSQQ